MPPSGKPSTVQTKTSKLGAKYGNKANQAVVAHAEDETTYGFIALPPGIINGVAQLQQCYFAEYKEGDNKGEYYFRASGVVIEPTVPVPTKTGPMIVTNLSTSIMVPFCETNYNGKKVPMEDNIQRILLEMRRLGGPEFTAGATVDDLEDLAAQLEEMAPFFKFSTQARIAQKDVPDKGIKKGDVLDGCFENWHGTQGLDDYSPPAPPKATVKAGGAAAAEVKPSGNGQKAESGKNGGQQPNPTHSTRAQKPTGKKPAAKEPEPEPEPEAPEEVDLDALAADAADTDSDTCTESGENLINLAIEAGVEEDWVRDSDTTWDMIVDAIRNQGDGDQGGDENDQAAQIPKVGEELGYCPINPRTKKPVDKPVKCEVIAVNEDEETVDLRSGKATYKNIPWSEIVELV